MLTLTVDDNPASVQAVLKLLSRIDPDGVHRKAESGTEALEIARRQDLDVVFLDIEMPDRSGLEVAERLKSLQPRANIVFLTAHSEYAIQAFGLYASGYLLKPVTESQLRTALENLRYAPSNRQKEGEKRLTVQCFGFFDVWCDGAPVRFGRSKTKQLLAYLIDRNGAMCDTQQMICALWPEEAGSSYASQVRVFLSDLQTTLTRLGLGGVLVRSHGLVGINKALVDCDYYSYLNGDPDATRKFNGEYMSQYSFGELTLAALTHQEGGA